MKQILIEISSSDIFEEVALQTSYAGVKTGEDIKDFDRIATVKEDERLLIRYWKDACVETSDRFKIFLTNTFIDDKKFSLTLELSGSYDDAFTPSVRSDLFSAITACTIAKWCRLALPGKAMEWEERFVRSVEAAFGKLCLRRRPTR